MLTLAMLALATARRASIAAIIKIALAIPIAAIVAALLASQSAWGSHYSGIGHDISNTAALLNGVAIALLVMPLGVIGSVLISRLFAKRRRRPGPC
jgi:ABC-type phosphate transport system permease subunit